MRFRIPKPGAGPLGGIGNLFPLDRHGAALRGRGSRRKGAKADADLAYRGAQQRQLKPPLCSRAPMPHCSGPSSRPSRTSANVETLGEPSRTPHS